MGILKNCKPNKGKKRRVDIRTYYPWIIHDLCKSMITLIVLLNFTPICEIYFCLQGSECSNAQRSKLVLEKNVPSWPNARKLHKKNDNGDEHHVCYFHCELITRKHKTNNCHPLPTLTKKTYKKEEDNKQVNKEIFLTCKEASVSIFINVKSYKKEIKN